VLVPTLVEISSGEIVYGLGPADFQLTDNGVPQQLLSFRPTDSTPGLHVLEVRLTRDLGTRVVARTSYWALAK
jgi:hypothetical protein